MHHEMSLRPGPFAKIADGTKRYELRLQDEKRRLIKELGDVAWYLAEAATGLNIDLSEVLQRNLDKLHARYPQGFDTNRSQHREAE